MIFMNTNNEKPTEKAFTNNKDIDIMKQRAEIGRASCRERV